MPAGWQSRFILQDIAATHYPGGQVPRHYVCAKVTGVAMRIAILLTDVDDSDFTRSFPNDAEKFRRLLQPLRPHWEYAIYSVKDNI